LLFFFAVLLPFVVNKDYQFPAEAHISRMNWAEITSNRCCRVSHEK